MPTRPSSPSERASHALRPLLRIVGAVAGLALLVAVFRIAAQARTLSFSPVPLVVAMALGAACWACLARAWAALVGDPAAANAWVLSQVLRYLPGGIWAPGARAATAKRRALGAVWLVIVEALCLLAAAVSVGALEWAVRKPVVAVAAVVVFAPALLARWFPVRLALPSPAAIVRATAWQALGFLAYSASAVFAQASVAPVPSDVLSVGAASLASWAAGFLVVLAPSGAGVREWTYVTVLHGALSRQDAAAGALAFRAAFTVGELAIVLLAAVRSRLARGSTAERPPARSAARAAGEKSEG